MIRKTSIETYRAIKEEGLLSKRRFQVYEILYNYGPLTGAQVAIKVKERYGSWGQSETIRNRLTEMRDTKAVAEMGTVACPVSGRNVILWDVSGKVPVKIEKTITEEIIECQQKINKLQQKIKRLEEKRQQRLF